MTDQKQVTLYGLTEDMKTLEDMLDNSNLEGQEHAAAVIQSEITTMLQSKVDRVVMFDQYLEDTIEACEKRIKTIQALKKTLENKRESFNKYVLYCMDQLEVPELRGELCKVSIKKPSKKVIIEDENLLPVEFVKVERTISPVKAEIAKAIKEGREVPGAKLVDGERSIRLTNLTV